MTIRTNRLTRTGLVAAALVLTTGAGCEDQVAPPPEVSEGGRVSDVEEWNSTTSGRDGPPDMVFYCAGGLRFAATVPPPMSDETALARIPEQDEQCRG